MKTIVFGDIHGRLFWDKILQSENPDRVIFLGDYVSTHEYIPARQQLANLDRILDYKEANADRVTLLRGNHDTQHLGYFWARCSGLDSRVRSGMPRERYLALTQWILIDEELQTIFSHAGISRDWMEKWDVADIHDINAMPPSEAFGFSLTDPWDNYGDHPTQPLTWIRPQTLDTCCIDGWDQVVGHTPVRNITAFAPKAAPDHRIWLCDAMGELQYLAIEGADFIPRVYQRAFTASIEELNNDFEELNDGDDSDDTG